MKKPATSDASLGKNRKSFWAVASVAVIGLVGAFVVGIWLNKTSDEKVVDAASKNGNIVKDSQPADTVPSASSDQNPYVSALLGQAIEGELGGCSQQVAEDQDLEVTGDFVYLEDLVDRDSSRFQDVDDLKYRAIEEQFQSGDEEFIEEAAYTRAMAKAAVAKNSDLQPVATLYVAIIESISY